MAAAVQARTERGVIEIKKVIESAEAANASADI